VTTISVVSAIWGTGYHQFLPRWWQALAALDPAPDEIVLVCDSSDIATLVEPIPVQLGIDVRLVAFHLDSYLKDHDHGPEPLLPSACYWNEAVRAANTDWITTCAIDDVVYPDAMVDVLAAADAGADLLADGVRYLGSGMEWHGYWDPTVIGHQLTLPGTAPFTSDLFNRVGGFREHIRWYDWSFFMDCAVAGATAHQGQRLRILHDEGANRQTWSGSSLDGATRAAANQQIADYARSLGLL
jgi:hypothetical protein